MRYFLILAACLSLSTQSINGKFIMTGKGLETDAGFVKWDDLISLSHQVHILQASCVALAAALLYIKYFDTKCDSKQEESKRVL